MKVLERGDLSSVRRMKDERVKSGLLLLGSVGVWIAWVLASFGIAGQPFNPWSPHLVTPIVLICGIGLGTVLAQRWSKNKRVAPLVVLAPIAIYSAPLYANASAAVGALLVSLAFIAYLDLRTAVGSYTGSVATHKQSTSRITDSDSDKYKPRHLESDRQTNQLVLVVGFAIVGALLAFGSQAALLLLVPLLLVSISAVLINSGPPRWLVVGVGIFVAEMAAVAVIMLGVRDAWPSWLSAGESLSSARHVLWSDALSLWQQNPIFGAGPGTFTASSELASSTSDLAAVHSSFLQVGAELGAVGVLLLATIFVAGLLFATRGGKARGFIAGAAWTFLAVHSTLDHLEDFPVVALTAGILLGWASCAPASTEIQPKSP